jgi:hypothetical protein
LRSWRSDCQCDGVLRQLRIQINKFVETQKETNRIIPSRNEQFRVTPDEKIGREYQYTSGAKNWKENGDDASFQTNEMEADLTQRLWE